ncbi:hypothetical protein ISCGN_029184 [Ixodes scapularis]
MNILGIGLLVLLAASCVTCGPRIPRAPRELDEVIHGAPFYEAEKDQEAEVNQGATPYASNDEAEKSRETGNGVGEQPQDSGEDRGTPCEWLTPLGKIIRLLPFSVTLSSPNNSLGSFVVKTFCV